MADQLKDPLPTFVEDFGSDERISFSKLDNKYLAVLDDGTELEFDPATSTWAEAADEPIEPLDDEDETAAQLADLSRAGAGPSYNNGGSNNPRKRKDSPTSADAGGGGGGADRQQSGDGNGNDNGNGRARPAKKAKPARAPPPPRQNTAVYVTGLPSDATVDEVHDLFSRKAGVIAEEIDSGRPRIKMYTDEAGNFKGDALVVFFKPQSVEMAIMLLDDTEFRFEPGPAGQPKMKVQAADSSYKKTKYDEDTNGAEGGKAGEGAEGAAAAARPQRSTNNGDKQKIIRKTQKMAAKLADWSDDDVAAAPVESTSKRNRTVILRHMFTLAELEEDPAALVEIKEDIRDECGKLGKVTNVVLYDEEPDGVVAVKFSDTQAAQACIQLMHGRAFDGRIVEAGIAKPREKFKMSRGQVSDSD